MRKLFRSRSARGVIVLGILAVVTAALLAGPVTAGGKLTRAKVKRIAKNVATQVVNDLTYTKPQADARFAQRLFAVVADDGTLVRGSGVTSVVRYDVGDYGVFFNRSLTGCTGVASTGGYALTATSNTGLAIGQAHVLVPRNTGAGANEVGILTTNSGGTPTDRRFHLIVVC